MARLAHLRTFLAIYRAGSVSGALTTLHLTQPAASKHLKLLEAHLEQRLFLRRPSGLVPTGAAHALAHSAAPHLDALEALLAAARPSSDSLAGTLHLGGPAEFLSARIMPRLVEVTPGSQIKVRVTTGQTAALIEQLVEGTLDLVVATEAGDRRVQYQPLEPERFVLVGAPLWAGQWPSAASPPGDLPLLSYADDLPILRRYWRVVFGTPLRTQAALVFPDLRALAAAARAGAGVSVLPEYLIEEDLRAGTLVALHRPDTAPTNMLYLAWRKEGKLHPRTDVVRQELTRAFQGGAAQSS